MQLPSTAMSLTSGKLQTMKVIMLTHLQVVTSCEDKSKNDNVWISVIEGLHRHAAIFASLLCMKFDYSNNKIIPGPLQLDNFERAQILHYKNPGVTPREQLGQIVGNHFEACMLKTPMLIQGYIPNGVANQMVIPYSY